VPGLYGMKSLWWLTEIEVVSDDDSGYYERKGRSEEAIVKTMSRIDLPGHGEGIRGQEYLVRGLALAGTREIPKVQVNTDEGLSWQEIQLDPPLSQYAWMFWRYRWMIPGPGSYALRVRAMDGTGRWQSELEQEPAPDGAAGLHEVTVTVTG